MVPRHENTTLTAVIIAKNEERNIPRCLGSLSSCDELVVVDDFSADGTARISEEFGSRVVSHSFISFAEQRNWGIEKTGIQSEWILMLDADEVATPEFIDELKFKISTAADDVAGFCICRKTIFMDRWLKYSDGFPVWIMRVVRRGRAKFENAGHGEVLVPEVDGKLERITAPILHYSFSRGLADWITRHNRYSTNEALLEQKMLRHWSWRQLFSRDRSIQREALRKLSRQAPFRPAMRFLYQYIYNLGFLDGRVGLTYSLMMSWYEQMIVLKGREIRLDTQKSQSTTNSQSIPPTNKK